MLRFRYNGCCSVDVRASAQCCRAGCTAASTKQTWKCRAHFNSTLRAEQHIYISSWAGQHAQAPIGRQGLGTAHIPCPSAAPCASCRLDMHLRLVSGSGSTDASKAHLDGVRRQAGAQPGGAVPAPILHNLCRSRQQWRREWCEQAHHLLLPSASPSEGRASIHAPLSTQLASTARP